MHAMNDEVRSLAKPALYDELELALRACSRRAEPDRVRREHVVAAVLEPARPQLGRLLPAG